VTWPLGRTCCRKTFSSLLLTKSRRLHHLFLPPLRPC
jgi:hypothetical protein